MKLCENDCLIDFLLMVNFWACLVFSYSDLTINFLQAIRRRQLEVDRVELKRKIKEAVEQFDAKLLDLYKTRLAIEKCILAEELKILLYDRRMSIQDHLDREEERLQ